MRPMNIVALSAGSRHDMRTSFSKSAPTAPGKRIRAGTAAAEEAPPRSSSPREMRWMRTAEIPISAAMARTAAVACTANPSRSPRPPCTAARTPHAKGEMANASVARTARAAAAMGPAPPQISIRGRRPMTNVMPMPTR